MTRTVVAALMRDARKLGEGGCPLAKVKFWEHHQFQWSTGAFSKPCSPGEPSLLEIMCQTQMGATIAPLARNFQKLTYFAVSISGK